MFELMPQPECPKPKDCICPWSRRGEGPWKHMRIIHNCPIHDPEGKVVEIRYYDIVEPPGR